MGHARAGAIDALVDAALTSSIPSVSGDAEEELIRMGEATRLKADKEVVVLAKGVNTAGRAFMRVRMRAADSGDFTLPEVVMSGLEAAHEPPRRGPGDVPGRNVHRHHQDRVQERGLRPATGSGHPR